MLAINDDEDEHLCIRCNATIIGLDNYVAHRKSLCNKMKPTDKEHNQVADVFFQSLQLQSSVKRPSPAAVPSTSKAAAGMLTRSAKAAMLAMDPGPSMVSNKRGEDWIGGHSLKVTECDDNQTKLIKAVANISGSAKKEMIAPPFTLLDEFTHNADSNEDTDELDDMDDDDHHPTDKWKPIAPHAVGKWKPIYSGRDSATHWTSVSAVTPEPDHSDEWEEDDMVVKWKPLETTNRVEKLHDIEEDDEDVYMPPPGHTKGKWVPGAKDGLINYKAHIMDATAMHKEGGAVVYWCGPCNRHLGSKVVYDRHLLSKLHLKRVLPERELEFSGKSKNFAELPKRTIKPSSFLEDYECVFPNRTKNDDVQEIIIKNKRKRQPKFINCQVCKYRVKPFLLGKHLISHYHFRKSDLNDSFTKIQILENIHMIIRHSPFQCNPCKFYANWQAEFMRHWRTEQHRETMENLPGRFWCSFCKFECEKYTEISDHLIGDDHQEVIASINRSIPIIIRKRSIIRCPNCNIEFKYNIQLRKHAKFSCKLTVGSTASDEYQEMSGCNRCDYRCKSQLGILRHMKRRHNMPIYQCTVCSMQFFSSKEEIQKHRQQQAHRIKTQEVRRDKGFEVKDLTRPCPHCDCPRLRNVIELKRHIQDTHNDKLCSCPMCGIKFPLPQGLVWHIRNKLCSSASPEGPHGEGPIFKCHICPYETKATLELLLHQAMHDDSTHPKYRCPLCSRVFFSSVLKIHLRRHLQIKSHECDLCQMKFVTKSSLSRHIKKLHKPDGEEKKRDVPTKSHLCSICGASFSKRFTLQQHLTTHSGRVHQCLVAGCLYRGRTASELRQHMLTHSAERAFSCDVEGCGYSAKTKHQLMRHKKVHEEATGSVIKCTLCSFSTMRRTNFKKHFRIHADTRRFQCRYCSFTCNRLENLRKHVLKRAIHKNASLYECEYCTSEKYNTNFAKDFSVHLMTKHNTTYPDQKSAFFYVSEYLKEGRILETYSDVESSEKLSGTIVFNDGEEALDMESKVFMQPNNTVLMDDFPADGCYSVTEAGKLIRY